MTVFPYIEARIRTASGGGTAPVEVSGGPLSARPGAPTVGMLYTVADSVPPNRLDFWDGAAWVEGLGGSSTAPVEVLGDTLANRPPAPTNQTLFVVSDSVPADRIDFWDGAAWVTVSAPSDPHLLEVVPRNVDYTVVASDLRTWQRFTAGVPSLGLVTAGDVDNYVYIRNATGAELTILPAAGVTINGVTTLAPDQTLSAVVVGVNEWDTTGPTVVPSTLGVSDTLPDPLSTTERLWIIEVSASPGTEPDGLYARVDGSWVFSS